MPEASFLRISARSAELGAGLRVGQVLPTRQRRTIGAWCFLDHAGPTVLEEDTGMNVGPHPHIGLQTFTWMIEGEILHRDSLGNVQPLRPGQVNLMTAGRGISHTEESASASLNLHAAQLWIALPPLMQACEPAFTHYPDLPQWHIQGVEMTLLVGRYCEEQSPVQVHSPLLCLDLAASGGGVLDVTLNPAHEYGLLVLQGEARLAGESVGPDELVYLGGSRSSVPLALAPGAHALLLGGEPLPETPLIWWNFVAYDWNSIASARADWESGNARFGTVHGYVGEPYQAPPLSRSINPTATQPT
ncbi:pirin family protein [Pseudomonas asuensis]|uniref:Quercetin 2,3-dioxygenase n=1 Tax=Pseudomonas asuensis TaxID=1825787 RepID=A0ABQ2GWY7_9PSED|nr:pirin family protein [Pseudomonas asuensis]GGM16231.1 putative quercetin 2,3-dioxygenase [Pseudomonas asuensis]